MISQSEKIEIKAPHGTDLSCKGWIQESAMRMLMNNLDPEVAENPAELIVYGGKGKAARNWECFEAIVKSLKELENDETLLVQSGKPVAIFKTHENAPRVIISNSMLVPDWANWDEFRRLEALGLTMYGQMTAGSWIYIGTQGILQGTYETFAEAATQRFGGTLAGTVTLTGGLGGMGGARPSRSVWSATAPRSCPSCWPGVSRPTWSPTRRALTTRSAATCRPSSRWPRPRRGGVPTLRATSGSPMARWRGTSRRWSGSSSVVPSSSTTGTTCVPGPRSEGWRASARTPTPG